MEAWREGARLRQFSEVFDTLCAGIEAGGGLELWDGQACQRFIANAGVCVRMYVRMYL